MHFPGLSFISQSVYVYIHVACWRNLTAALPSWVASARTEIKDTQRVTTLSASVSCKDSLHVCVCVCSEWPQPPLMLKHTVHAVLICDPTLLTAMTLSFPEAICPWGRICLYVCFCTCTHRSKCATA
ncbi:hypothetical protein ILYODFUR_036880 [Ilyodon furcidens]|uniref:Secreted protein n=1 Tax=Ilyodon furcidens TaxID=33524 RepID=A0ABV0ST13_9TELE